MLQFWLHKTCSSHKLMRKLLLHHVLNQHFIIGNSFFFFVKLNELHLMKERYNHCHASNLNGYNFGQGSDSPFPKGIIWRPFNLYNQSLARVEMAVKGNFFLISTETFHRILRNHYFGDFSLVRDWKSNTICKNFH
jgi:hypothetical protein